MQLRETFDTVAELYDRARPLYPPAVFDDLCALGRLEPGARVLEVGCGTGIATLPLAERGYRMTCVELGEHLAAVARRKLTPFGADIVVADFETWEPRRGGFDAVVAFTAFHWIAPGLRYAKPAALLRPGGVLGVVEMHHVLPPGGDRFFAEVQADYEAVTPDDADEGPQPPETIADLGGELDASGFFCDVATRRYVWELAYTADSYIDVLNTYSGHRALDEERRAELFARIRRRIVAHGGRVRKTYLTTLNVGTKR